MMKWTLEMALKILPASWNKTKASKERDKTSHGGWVVIFKDSHPASNQVRILLRTTISIAQEFIFTAIQTAGRKGGWEAAYIIKPSDTIYVM